MSDIDVITRENQRLQKEVALLRERVAALERSRWWRLHPRFLARHAVGAARRPRESAQETGPAQAPEPTPRPLSVRSTKFRDEVAARGEFTETWFYAHVEAWEPVLGELDGRPACILEIGSYEGLSACYVLWRLPQAHVTCIDTFEGSPENVAYGGRVHDLETRFDLNVALVDAARVRKLRGDSRRVLLDLVYASELFDLVYVDGSHRGLDVIVDAALAWPLLHPDGVMVFDDYRWMKLGEDPLTRPGPAIDAFLALVGQHCAVLFRDGQVAVRKVH